MKKNKESTDNEEDKTKYNLKMKKNEELQNEVHIALMRKPTSISSKTGIYVRVGKYMKIFGYMFLLAGVAITFNSCMGGYIASEPAYTEYARPQRPSETHIWIGGDWNWNYSTHTYIQRAGYWEQPRHGQTYIEGNWQTTQRGKSWNKGHWQKDNQPRNNDNKHRQDNGNRKR
jgi:hypothetical protein